MLLSEEVMLTLLVSLTFVSTYADGNCCPKKYVHGEWYTFVKIDPNAKTEFGCLDNCVYQNDDSMGLVCFKKGEYMSKCVEETVSLGGCLGILRCVNNSITWSLKVRRIEYQKLGYLSSMILVST